MVQRYAFFFDYTNFCVNLYLLTLIFPVTTPLPLAYHPVHSYSFPTPFLLLSYSFPTPFLPVFCNCDTVFFIVFRVIICIFVENHYYENSLFPNKMQMLCSIFQIYKYQKYNNITYKCSIKIVYIYVKNML